MWLYTCVHTEKQCTWATVITDADYWKSQWVHTPIPPSFPLFVPLPPPPLVVGSLNIQLCGLGECCKILHWVQAEPDRQRIFVTLCTWKQLFFWIQFLSFSPERKKTEISPLKVKLQSKTHLLQIQSKKFQYHTTIANPLFTAFIEKHSSDRVFVKHTQPLYPSLALLS